MRRMRLPKDEETQESAYHNKLEKWTDKEMQLNVLHEEIITKREALLRTSRNFLSRTGLEGLPVSDTEAAIRGDRLLREMKDLEEEISSHQMEPPSPQFANLQKNYWSMVDKVFPVWQKSQGDSRAKAKAPYSTQGSNLGYPKQSNTRNV